MTDADFPLTRDLKNTFFDAFKDQGDLHYSPVAPNPLSSPVLVSSNNRLAKDLGLKPDDYYY